MKMNNQAKLERTNVEKINKTEERVAMVGVDMRYQMKKMSNKVKRTHNLMFY
ncbi:MAG: hypothetical protein KAS62_02730 [Candidatus Delongbacteria bacterium]|nr:hypothetical protein [Candidatus Delongbacteria bacterium]